MAVQMRNGTLEETITLVKAEYDALRAELLKLEEIQHQIISLSIVASGSILAVGFQSNDASILFLYPLLALFLAAIWLSCSHSIERVAWYIRNHIEAKVGECNIGWEHFNERQAEPVAILGFFGYRAIFIGTEVAAILSGYSFAGNPFAKFGSREKILFIFALISCILTIIILVVFDIKRVHHKGLRLYPTPMLISDAKASFSDKDVYER